MPEYEYRFKSSTGDMKLGSILNVESDALAKAHGGMAFATFLGFRQFGALASRQAHRDVAAGRLTRPSATSTRIS